jgi:hypothetical protein
VSRSRLLLLLPALLGTMRGLPLLLLPVDLQHHQLPLLLLLLRAQLLGLVHPCWHCCCCQPVLHLLQHHQERQ